MHELIISRSDEPKKERNLSNVNPRRIERIFLVHRLIFLFVLSGFVVKQGSLVRMFLSSFPEELIKNDTMLDGPTFNQNTKEDLDEFGYMAVCLYVNDENYRLVEWIPYHYYVAGVRRIIVMNTPFSTSTPRPILDRWKDRINVTLWNEYGPEDFQVDTRWIPEAHVINQLRFLARCYKALKQEGWNLAFSIDVDEYLLVNNLVRDLVIPTQREASSISKLLKRVEPFRNVTNNPFLHSRPCLQYTRKNFSNKATQSSNDTIFQGIDTSKMNTFRWRLGSPKNPPGKGIAELSRVSYRDISYYRTPHLPITNQKICLNRGMWISEAESPVLIHHYPASWAELITRKNRPRNLKYQEWVDKAKGLEWVPGRVKYEADETNTTELLEYRYNLESRNDGKIVQGIQEWLHGFVDFVGRKEANRLLQHVGDPEMAMRGARIVWGNQTRD